MFFFVKTTHSRYTNDVSREYVSRFQNRRSRQVWLCLKTFKSLRPYSRIYFSTSAFPFTPEIHQKSICTELFIPIARRQSSKTRDKSFSETRSAKYDSGEWYKFQSLLYLLLEKKNSWNFHRDRSIDLSYKYISHFRFQTRQSWTISFRFTRYRFRKVRAP